MVGLWILVGILMVGPSLGNPGGEEESKDDTIYTFAVSASHAPYEFVSPEGDMDGLSVHIIRRVCEVAGKTCALVTYYNKDDCWSHELRRGQGLDNQYWLACGSSMKTKATSLVYDFPGDFLGPRPAALYVRAKSSIFTYHPGTHRTGFLRHSFQPSCLKTELNMDIKLPVFFNTADAMTKALQRGEIEVMFTKDLYANSPDLRKLGNDVKCSSDGISPMVRKDSITKFDWWKPAVEEVIGSSFYEMFCSMAEKNYGFDPYCLSDE